MDNIELLVPKMLQDLGYLKNSTLIKLAEKCFNDDEYHPYWVEIRSMLEYVCCIEFAYNNITKYPTGKALLGNNKEVEIRYHTASIVFFSKALLDNLAMFLSDKYQLKIRNPGKALDKKDFKDQILKVNPEIYEVIVRKTEYLEKLTSYRTNWIHRLVGGSFLGGSSKSRKDGSFVDADLLVSLDPNFDIYRNDNSEMIEQIKKKHNGQYLITAKDFSTDIYSNSLNIFFEILDNSLSIFDK